MDKDQQCATMTHPSVRLRGTEHDFKPQMCTDPQCRVAAAGAPLRPSSSPLSRHLPHMHCPFCVPTDVYQDAVILRAHYQVKHVDKGIDFAGLRILRCCSRCDIVGFIKSEKKFHGAHWHCYRCKNGFKRRDEAIKHYRTHFRNPLTTFQIHIAQEVNGCVADKQYPQQQQQPLLHDSSVNLHVPRIVERSAVNSDESSSSSLNNNIALPNEAVVIVQRDDESESVVNDPMDDHTQVATSTPFSVDTRRVSEEDVELPDTESWDSGCRMLKLEQQVKDLQLKNKHLEQHYKDEMQQLKIQVDLYSKEIEQLKKREQDLLRCLVGDYVDRSQELFESLQAQHTRLLQQQLLQVRQWALTQQHENGIPVTTTTTATMEAPTFAFPSDVFRLVLDGGSNLMTPTKLLLQSGKDGEGETEIECESTVADTAEVVISADVSLADEAEYVHYDHELSAT